VSEAPDPVETLLSPAGRALLERVTGRHEDLALATGLRREYPADLVAAAFTQAELRTAARAKFSRAELMLFTRAGLEQASGELTARHRASRIAAGARVADLCCGIGGDLSALAAGREAVGYDADPVAVRLAAHNAAVYDSTPETVAARAEEVDLAGVDVAFLDPARRDPTGRRGGYRPALSWCLSRPVPTVVKAAPGLDRALVPAGWEVEFVAVGRELREAVLWGPLWAAGLARATVLPAGESLLADPDDPPAPLAPPGPYLLDPSPAVTRAGAVASLAARTGGWQLDRRIAFLGLDAPVVTPFGRCLEVRASLPWTLTAGRRALNELGVGVLDVRRRGLAGDVDVLRRQLRLRGSGRAVLVLTRVADRPWGLVCTDPRWTA